MTDEQFNALAPFEDRFRTAVHDGWCRYPGLAALQTMAAVYTAVTGQGVRINSGCSRCVLHIVQDAGRIFFAEKDRRTAEETAKKEKTADNTAKKKTAAKRKETTKDAKV